MTRVAALDCGTNSTRLLIADESGATVRREMRITRLGENVDATGTLSDAAIERTIDVLEQYATMMRDAGVATSSLIATSAARDASNGARFLARAGEVTGAHVALLTGDEEAALSFRGATADLDPDGRVTLIVDIGGGSTELAAMVAGRLRAWSMQVGCVRVTERALGSQISTPLGIERTRSMINGELERAFVEVPEFESVVGHARVVGLAGTVATLAQLDVGLTHYDRDVVHHRTLSRADVARWRGDLEHETPSQRLARPGMVAGREDVLVGGLYILEAVLARFAASELLSSENDILDGLVAQLLSSPSDEGVISSLPTPRRPM